MTLYQSLGGSEVIDAELGRKDQNYEGVWNNLISELVTWLTYNY
jgi:hypothetical protein